MGCFGSGLLARWGRGFGALLGLWIGGSRLEPRVSIVIEAGGEVVPVCGLVGDVRDFPFYSICDVSDHVLDILGYSWVEP